MRNEPAVAFDNFSFRYAARTEKTLNEISLQIRRGQKILIAGVSGSGKSTLGHCLNGLIPHSFAGEQSGKLAVAGFDPAARELHEVGKCVGTVLQDTDGQFIGLSVGEDIAFALENDNRDQAAMSETVRGAAALVGMEQRMSQSPFALSGGEKQRVSLAGILVDDVEILLFDEPLANLDPAAGKRAIELIERLHDETGRTVVIIEHRLEDVLYRPIDRIVLIDKGRIVADQAPDAILAGPLLTRHGIREPLYLTAIRLSGQAPDEADRPANLERLQLQPYREGLLRWFRRRPEIAPVRKRPELLGATGLCYSYDGERATLSDVEFSIHQGETVALMGENGAGKSSLAKLITGVLRPDAGMLKWEGEDMSPQSISERSSRIGFVMQNPNHMISRHMIRDEVGFALRIRGLGEAEVNERVEAALQTCGLHPFRNWPVSVLSYGQKKRVTIASVLVMQPRLLIMDEPTAGQDYRCYTEFMEFVRNLSHETGLAILLITHDLHLALEYAERALVLSKGRLLADAPVEQVFSDAALLAQASLKETSLFGLARRLGIDQADEFIAHFIRAERSKRSGRSTEQNGRE